MKTLALLMAVLTLALASAPPASADPDRYEWRTFGGVNIDLQPLFTWWSFVSHATNEPIIMTQVDSNKLTVLSNLWSHLPARPLPQWLRIQSREDKIAVAGNMWKVDATIQPAPMMLKQETIYLRNPPTREIQNFKQYLAARNALQAQQDRDVALEQYYQSNIQAQANSFVNTNLQNSPAVPPPPPPSDADMAAFQQNSYVAGANISSAHDRMVQRDAQIAPLDQFLATFPDKSVYWLDHFAMRTGEKVDGLDVYDMGSAANLTY